MKTNYRSPVGMLLCLMTAATSYGQSMVSSAEGHKANLLDATSSTTLDIVPMSEDSSPLDRWLSYKGSSSGGKKESSDDGSGGKKSGGYSSSGGKKSGGGSGGGTCLPGVNESGCVKDIKAIICDKRTEFEATMVTTISEDPCELGAEVLNKFLAKLMDYYNRAQFEACDSSFRRMTDFELIDICSQKHDTDDYYYYYYYHNGHHNIRRLNVPDFGWVTPWRGTFSTTNRTAFSPTTNSGNQGGRRRPRSLFLQDFLDNSNQIDSDFLLLRGSGSGSNNDNSVSGMDKVDKEHDRALGYTHVPPQEQPKCFCPAKAELSEGITNADFTDLAKKAMKQVTNGHVHVSDQFQVNEGCPPGKRVNIQGGAVIYLNVDVNTLSEKDLQKMEENCVLAYNNYVIEFCPPSYTQIRKCELSPLYMPNPHGQSGTPSANNALIAHLYGDASYTDGVLDPLVDESARRLLFSPADDKSVSLEQALKERDFMHRMLPSSTWVNTLPKDMCFCKFDAEDGRSPTPELFASFFNCTGIVESALEVTPKTCHNPRVYSQTVYAIVDGNVHDPKVRHELEQYLQDTLNTLSVVKCVASHFYVFSTDIVWWEEQHMPEYQHPFAVMFETHFVSYNDAPDQSYLYKADGRRQRELSFDESMNHNIIRRAAGEGSDGAHDGRVLPAAQSSCACAPGVSETPILKMMWVNQQLEDNIDDLHGVHAFYIVEQ
ncbi:hypothetical protein ACA910_001859 [Epithemia clementina (nom. ined.)]